MNSQDHKYDDIIGLPHPTSKRHPRMPRSDRAAQFAPFAALTGYGDVIADTTLREEAKYDQKWEEEYGRIPEGAFVAFRSDWYKKSNLDNPDENGQPHYPGWDKAAIQWLVENRNIGAIGHEPADTDPATVTTKPDAYPYPGEQYILEVDRFQIEVMRNLDQVPAVGSLIVCAFPKLKDGVGFPARCFAICPAD